MTTLRIPGGLSELPLQNTETEDRQQQWRQVGWWDMRTFEVHGMDADHTGQGGIAPLWIQVVDVNKDGPSSAAESVLNPSGDSPSGGVSCPPDLLK